MTNERGCLGCGSSLNEPKPDEWVHANQECWGLWERACLLKLESEARWCLRYFEGTVPTDDIQMQRGLAEALTALDTCRAYKGPR